MSFAKLTISFLTAALFLTVVSSIKVHAQNGSMDLSITLTSQKQAYYYREPVIFTGQFRQNGQLVTNGTVGIAIYDTSTTPLPVAFRALKTGQTPINYLMSFTELVVCNDSTGVAVDSFLPLQTVWPRFTIHNSDSVDHNYIVTITIFDANGIPLATRLGSLGVIPAGQSELSFCMGPDIPVWAQPGNATLVACVFSSNPKDGGVPYCEEEKVNFQIKRNPELEYWTQPMSDPTSPSGSYACLFKFTKELEPGQYQVYVSARSTLTNGTQQNSLTVENTTLFSILNARMPPQAAFTYYPVDSFVNMSITFDASASTAEGYNVSLVKYEWDFGNGTKYVSTTPTIANVFTTANNYTVTLNVTDSQGLWSTTTKIAQIMPPAGPTANFIWSPSIPSNLTQVVFDASSTTLGWDGVTHPPIASYTWDFGDGNVTGPGSYNVIVHRFLTDGNYTVKLNVTDASGYKGYVSKTVQVRRGGIRGDINGDGTVNIYDAILLSIAYNSQPGSLSWNPNADINGDGVVNILDAIILSSNYGKSG
jgi:PKD repeat protein